MKFERVFYAKDNKLYKIDDDSAVNLDDLKKIEIFWSKIEIEDEIYNEEFLAALRDELKSLENLKKFAILVPVVDKPIENEERAELFMNACNHAARRVKDCASVAGFEIPAELKNADDFTELLSKKHPQYVYFSRNEKIKNDSIVVYQK